MRIAIEALAQLARSGQLNQMGQCTIFPSVRHLLMHLSLPNEGPPPMPMMPGAPGPPPGYMGIRPATSVAPGGMMPMMDPALQRAGPGVAGQQFMN